MNVSVPFTIEQAKQLHDILSRWVADGTIDPANPIDTAVVLPDESLLLPVLYSIPEEIKTINITMGLPYARTTFASLFRAVVSMQKRARKIHGTVHFYYEDVDEILSHPHIRLIAPDECEQLKKHIADKHIYNIYRKTGVKNRTQLVRLFDRESSRFNAALRGGGGSIDHPRQGGSL